MEYKNKIICGDCLEVMKKIPDKSIDLVLTDPPYGIEYQSNMRKVSLKFNKIKNDNNNSRFKSYKEFNRLLKDNGIAIVFASFKNYAYDYIELQKYFNIRNAIVWSKGGGGIGDLKHSLSTDYEIAIIAHKGNAEIQGKREGSVWKIPKILGSHMLHPTEKPMELLKRIIEKFSTTEHIVLDCYAGSGSTLVAAKQLKRDFIGIEISPEYCKIAEERLSKIQGTLL